MGSKHSHEGSSPAERERVKRPLESILILSPNIKVMLTCILSSAALHYSPTRYLIYNLENLGLPFRPQKPSPRTGMGVEGHIDWICHWSNQEPSKFSRLTAGIQSVPKTLYNHTFPKNVENIRMVRLFSLFVLLWMGSRAHGQEKMNVFIKDLVATFQLSSPTIIYDNDDEIPEICFDSQWALCLSSNEHEMDLKKTQYNPESYGESENNGTKISCQNSCRKFSIESDDTTMIMLFSHWKVT